MTIEVANNLGCRGIYRFVIPKIESTFDVQALAGCLNHDSKLDRLISDMTCACETYARIPAELSGKSIHDDGGNLPTSWFPARQLRKALDNTSTRWLCGVIGLELDGQSGVLGRVLETNFSEILRPTAGLLRDCHTPQIGLVERSSTDILRLAGA